MDNPDAAAERACEQISIAFANAIDCCDYDAVIDLFASDGILDRWRSAARRSSQAFRGSSDAYRPQQRPHPEPQMVDLGSER
jgi:hypothetical protein